MKVDLQLQGLALLLAFIAPGFLFSRNYAAFRPRYYRSPDVFEQTVMTVVASTLIHILFVGILSLLALVYWGLKGQSPFLRDVLDVPLKDYPLWMLTVNALAVVVYLLLSLVFAYRTGAFLGRLSAEETPRWFGKILGSRPPESILLWHIVLQEEPIQRGIFPPRLITWLRSGERFEGNLVTLRLCGDEANTIELALEDVSYTPTVKAVVRPSEVSKPPESEELPSQKVLLRSSDILWLSRVDAPQ
jgi:hypothetical protein